MYFWPVDVNIAFLDLFYVFVRAAILRPLSIDNKVVDLYGLSDRCKITIGVNPWISSR